MEYAADKVTMAEVESRRRFSLGGLATSAGTISPCPRWGEIIDPLQALRQIERKLDCGFLTVK